MVQRLTDASEKAKEESHEISERPDRIEDGSLIPVGLLERASLVDWNIWS